MPMHITLDCPDTKNLWEKSFKYTVNVDSNHPTDTLSLKVPIFKSGFLDLLLIWRREFEKIWCLKDWNTMPANLITNRRIFHNGKGLEMFESVFEAQIGNNNVTITWFNNTMQNFMTSMCPTDVGEDITNWQINIRRPHHIKVKWFVTHIKEINRFLPFLPPPFKTSRKQEELFAIIKKSIPSFERLFAPTIQEQLP